MINPFVNEHISNDFDGVLLRFSSNSRFYWFFSNFHRAKNIFVLGWFKKCWMFWKAMGLNRSFLQSKSRRTRLWYPLKVLSDSNCIFDQLCKGFFGNGIWYFWHRPKNIFWCSEIFETFFCSSGYVYTLLWVSSSFIDAKE